MDFEYRWSVTDRPSLLERLDWLRHKGFRANFASHIAKLNTLTPAEQEQVINDVGDDIMPSAHTMAIPQEFVERLPGQLLDALILRTIVGRDQRTATRRAATFLLVLFGIFVRF